MRHLDWDKIKELYLAGNSTYEVADILGCTQQSIANACRKMGIVRSISMGKIVGWRKRELSTNWEAQRKRARNTVALKLGRKLETSEEVHHKDSNYSNESDSNLVLLDYGLHRSITHWDKGPGVTYQKLTGKWIAQVRLVRKRIYLGLFATKDEALKVVEDYRKQVEVGLFGELVKIEREKRAKAGSIK